MSAGRSQPFPNRSAGHGPQLSVFLPEWLNVIQTACLLIARDDRQAGQSCCTRRANATAEKKRGNRRKKKGYFHSAGLAPGHFFDNTQFSPAFFAGESARFTGGHSGIKRRWVCRRRPARRWGSGARIPPPPRPDPPRWCGRRGRTPARRSRVRRKSGPGVRRPFRPA